MSMLQQIMANVTAGARSAQQRASRGSGSQKEDPNVTAYRKVLENATRPGSGYSPQQIQGLIKQAPSALDVTPFTVLSGNESPEQIAQRQYNDKLSRGFMQLLNGGQPVQTPTPSKPTFTPSGSIQVNRPQTSTQTPGTKPADIFTDDFLVRSALKKFSGIDVGAHYLESDDWFKSYGDRVQNGIPVSQAVSDTAIEYGFVPAGASNLKDLSEPERKVLFEKELQSALNDETLDAVVRKFIPKGVDPRKAKTGLILGAFAEQGLYIPEHYQPFLDRYRGLEDPTFVSDELKTWAYQNTGKMPSELTSNDVANARKSMQDDAIIQAQREAYWRKRGTTKAEWDVELSKPISAEDRAKYGVGSGVKTYAQLADEGKRFASEADKKMYQELYTARARLLGMKELLFGSEKHPENGIFTGIGVSATARTAAKAKLLYEKVNGTQRGRNLEEYNDYMAYFARTLIKIAGESGSRLSDQGIEGIMASMSDPGKGLLGVPDAEPLAKSKFDRAAVDMARLMQQLEDTTTVTSTNAQPTAPQKYEIGKTYTDAQGRKAKYIGGEKPWQILP